MSTVPERTPEQLAPSIPKTMQAVVCHGPEDYRLETVDVPTPGPDEILTKVDLFVLSIRRPPTSPLSPSTTRYRSYLLSEAAQMITGHEFVCRVVALGPGAEKRGVAVGDRVISEQIVPCWGCRFCNHGQYWMCQKHDLYGFQNNVQGAMAQYMIFTKEGIIHKVPESIAPDEAILIEPLACSLHAAERANVDHDDIVVVAGAGTLGLGIIGAVRLRNPKKLIVLDMKPERAALALRLGADEVWNPAEVDVLAKIREITDGYGCDIYIEATGHHKAVNQGLAMLRKLGRFVEFSVFNDEATVDWSIIGDRKELDILGSHLGPYMYPRAIDFIGNRKIDMRDVVTHKFALADFKEAFAVMERGDKSLKVVLEP